MLLHGLVGGAMSAANGGNFGTGFLSAVVAKSVTIGTRTVIPQGIAQGAVVAIAGGIAAELGGGKFSNGAVSAAMAYALNEASKDPTFYEEMFSDTFFEDFEEHFPFEHALFKQYASSITTDLWPDNSDLRWKLRELYWSRFDQFARGASVAFSKSVPAGAIDSIYGPTTMIGKLIGGIGGNLLVFQSDIGTIIDSHGAFSVFAEAQQIVYQGPQLINEDTWSSWFGPYNSDLNEFR